MVKPVHFCVIFLVIVVLITYCHANSQDLRDIMNTMENDAKSLALKMETYYDERCTTTVDDCDKKDYNNCNSKFPNPVCVEERERETCSSSMRVAEYDFTTSNVRLPESLVDDENNPRDNEVKEMICSSRSLNKDFIELDRDSGTRGGVQAAFFGSYNGAFRIFPASHSDNCGSYDPRKRPWFAAASSGPKDVVIVLDVSGSMALKARMDKAKEAAVAVISTLTIGDHFSVVKFSSGAIQLLFGNGKSIAIASKENKDYMINAVNSISPNGGTNFANGFRMAFDALDTGARDETTSNCQEAILFLTDGEPNDDVSATIDLINERNRNVNATIFTYSLGSGADSNVMKQIACSTGGIWSSISDSGDLVSAMSAYFQLYSMGMSSHSDASERFASWVEPYSFSTGGVKGTTVSTAVYDRSVIPHKFVGVVGIDFPLEDMQKAVGDDYQAVLDELVQTSTAICPKFEISDCQLQALRYETGGENAMCTGECSDLSIESTFEDYFPLKCRSDDYTSDIWNNKDKSGMVPKDRLCCEFKINTTLLITIIGSVVGFLGFVLFIYFCRKKCKNKNPPSHHTPAIQMNPVNHYPNSNESVYPVAPPNPYGNPSVSTARPIAVNSYPAANPSYPPAMRF